MVLSSDSEQFKHPKHGLLPKALLDSQLFKSGLSDDELAFMTTDLATIPCVPSTDVDAQLRAWICVLSGHPEASADELWLVGETFSLSPAILFQGAILSNRQDLLSKIETDTTDIKMVISDALYELVAELGYDRSLEILRVMVPPEENNLFIILEAASRHGSLSVLSWFKTRYPDYFDSRSQDARSCGSLLSTEHLSVLQWFKQELPAMEFVDAIRSAEKYVVEFAVLSNDPVHLTWLRDETPIHLEEWATADKYSIIRGAIDGSCLEVLAWFKKEAPDMFQKMIGANNYEAFRLAASRGKLDILNWFKKETPDKLQEMIGARGYSAFCLAAENGCPKTLNWFKEEAPDELQAMIAADNYGAFRSAASRAPLKISNWLKKEAQMIGVYYDYDALSLGALKSQLGTLDWLKKEAPDKLQEMIGARDYYAFRYAAYNGQLDILNWLKNEAPDRLQAMIRADDYDAFRSAAQNGHLETVQYLLSFPSCFAYAEMHVHEYGERYIHPFVAEKLSALHSQYQEALLENPNAVFNLENEDEIKLCFYIIRNLIRRNEPALLDDLRFLLDIPAVKAILHEAITPGEPNELLRLALTTGNAEADALLQLLSAPEENVVEEDVPAAQISEDASFYLACYASLTFSVVLLVAGTIIASPVVTAIGAALAVGTGAVLGYGFFSNKLSEDPGPAAQLLQP